MDTFEIPLDKPIDASKLTQSEIRREVYNFIIYNLYKQLQNRNIKPEGFHAENVKILQKIFDQEYEENKVHYEEIMKKKVEDEQYFIDYFIQTSKREYDETINRRKRS